MSNKEIDEKLRDLYLYCCKIDEQMDRMWTWTVWAYVLIFLLVICVVALGIEGVL